MSREQLSYLLRLVKSGMLERATTIIEQELAKPEQEPFTLVCPKCGADRTKESCKGDLSNCWLKGFAHTQTEQAEKQEPVATRNRNGMLQFEWGKSVPIGTKLYTAPPRKKWVGLTDEQIKMIVQNAMSWEHAIDMAEAKLKELNAVPTAQTGKKK